MADNNNLHPKKKPSSAQPTADWRWQEQKQQLAAKQTGKQKLESGEADFPATPQMQDAGGLSSSEIQDTSAAESYPEQPYAEQGLTRYESASEASAVSLGEDSITEVKPMGIFAFVIFMSLAALADGIDLIDVPADAATAGVWIVISLVMDILVGLAFFIWSYLLCDKYTRQVMLKTTETTGGDIKEKMLALAKNLKFLATTIKAGSGLLQIGDGIPILEIMPFTMITVGIMYIFSHYVARQVKTLEEAETVEEAEQAFKKIQRAERGLQTATSLLDTAKQGQADSASSTEFKSASKLLNRAN